MAKSHSKKSSYQSRYSPQGWVTPAQYITELVCENKSKSELPIKFYELKEWQKHFRWQIGIANKLLKKYEARAIIKVVKGSRIWSLRPDWVEEAIAKEHKSIITQDKILAEKIEKNQAPEVDRSANKTYKRVEAKSEQSLRSKLDNL